MSIKCWLPTLNRACQTHLLLESIEKNAPGLFEICINYDFTNDEYGTGYARLINSPLGQSNNVVWQRRGVYGKDFRYFLTTHVQDELFTHFVDDCIFYRKNDITEEDVRCILDEVWGWNIWGFNWRVGLDTVVNNHRNKKSIEYPKSLKYTDLVCSWDYTEYSSLWENYWSFAYSLDGMTYRVNDVLEYLSYKDINSFDDPAWTEHWLCHSPKRSNIQRPYMESPLRSNVFSNHLNSVHSRGYDPAGQFSISHEELNRQYLLGYKISLESFDFSGINCGHQQLPFELIKE